jgi:hypothetical protein
MLSCCFRRRALACAPSVQMTGQWVDKELFQPGSHSMFIAVMSQNLSVKQVFEDDIATRPRHAASRR